MVVHNIENKEAFDELLSEHKTQHPVVVLDAFATWCGPCKVIAPKVATFSNTYTNVHFTKVDVDDVPLLAQELGIRAMPTFVVFKDGVEFKRVVGANPVALEAAIEGAIVEEEADEDLSSKAPVVGTPVVEAPVVEAPVVEAPETK